jgi:hypothetical protein
MAFFSSFYSDFVVDLLRRARLIEASIGGNRRRRWCREYLGREGLALDEGGRSGPYDVVVTCTDVVVQSNVRDQPLVVVQEGIFDPDGVVADACRKFRFLPRWFAGTALTGESGSYDRFCAASEGYRERLLERGVPPEAVVVTGMPGFDDCRTYLKNNFPHHGYVLVCTSDTRETLKFDNRRRLIERALELAAGRKLIFKLHPNENERRSRQEIERHAPNALVYQQGSAEEMIANCDVLITQWSSTVFVGMALGKEVYSNFARAELERLMPWQNGGTSAARIADVCRALLASPPQAKKAPLPRMRAHARDEARAS